jgi:hypothetical protein
MRGFVGELRGSVSAVAGNPGLRRLAMSLVLAEVSAPVYFTACGVWAFGHGGPMLAATVGVVALVPAALVAPVAAVLADRARRGLVLSLSLATRAGLLALLAIGIVLDAAWLVLCMACLASICARVFYPAVAASLPTLSRSRDELVVSNAVVSGTEHVGSVVGPALAGAALVIVAPAVVCAMAAAGTLAAAVAVVRLDAALRAPQAGGDEPSCRTRQRGLAVGFASLLGHPHARRLVGAHVAHCLALGALSVALIQLALDELRVGTAGLGVLEGALAVGGIAGGVVALARASTQSTNSSVRFGGMLWAVPFCAMCTLVHPVVAVGGLVVAGVGNVVLDVAVYTHVQESADDGVIARAVAALQSLAVAAVGFGSLVAGISLSLAGTRMTLLGIGLVVGAPVGALARSRTRTDDTVRKPAVAPAGG